MEGEHNGDKPGSSQPDSAAGVALGQPLLAEGLDDRQHLAAGGVIVGPDLSPQQAA